MTEIETPVIVLVALALALVSVREVFSDYAEARIADEGPKRIRATYKAHGTLAAVLIAPLLGWIVASQLDWTTGVCIVISMGVVTVAQLVKKAIAQRIGGSNAS